jgi:multicomponent K+:H+ antiporter subunit A
MFDLGVFAVVVGATVLILIVLAHQSVRTPRTAQPRRLTERPALNKEKA